MTDSAPSGGDDAKAGAATDRDAKASEPPQERRSTFVRRAMGVTGARPIPPQRHHPEPNPQGHRLKILTLGALGVVYGDIGTSPLYALQACFKPEYNLAVTIPNVYGVLS